MFVAFGGARYGYGLVHYLVTAAVMNRPFWSIARRYILAYWTSFYGSWTGKAIICVENYSEPTDLPPNILTENESKELQQGWKGSDFWDNDYNSIIGTPQTFMRAQSTYMISPLRGTMKSGKRKGYRVGTS